MNHSDNFKKCSKKLYWIGASKDTKQRLLNIKVVDCINQLSNETLSGSIYRFDYIPDRVQIENIYRNLLDYMNMTIRLVEYDLTNKYYCYRKDNSNNFKLHLN